MLEKTLLESNKGTNLSKNNDDLDTSMCLLKMACLLLRDTIHSIKLRCTQQLKSVDILSYKVTENK